MLNLLDSPPERYAEFFTCTERIWDLNNWCAAKWSCVSTGQRCSITNTWQNWKNLVPRNTPPLWYNTWWCEGNVFIKQGTAFKTGSTYTTWWQITQCRAKTGIQCCLLVSSSNIGTNGMTVETVLPAKEKEPRWWRRKKRRWKWGKVGGNRQAFAQWKALRCWIQHSFY